MKTSIRWTLISVVTLTVCAAAACSSESDDAASGGSGGTAGQAGGGLGGASGTSGSAGTSGASGSGGSGGSSDAGTCTSQEVTFTPTWTPPQPLHQGVCSEAEIDEIVKACFEGGGKSACATARAAHPTCDACLITDDTQSQLGAIVYYESLAYYDRNLAGCIAHAEGDLGATGCGAKAQAVFWECPQESCAGCFPVTNNDFSPVTACSNDAYEGTCKTYMDAFNSCATGVKYSHCIWMASETWSKMARRYADLFCGSLGDGGTGDAGDAADSSG